MLHGLRSVGIGRSWFGEWFLDGGLEFLAPEGETGLEVDDRAFSGNQSPSAGKSGSSACGGSDGLGVGRPAVARIRRRRDSAIEAAPVS